MKRQLLSLIVVIITFFAIIFTYSCEDEETNHKPTCTITSPVQDSIILKGEIVTITADADDEDGNLKEVRFYIDNNGVSATSTFPYTYQWNTNEISLGTHTLKAEAIDDKNAKAESSVSIEIIDNALTADFIADKTIIALGDTIYFSDQSETIPYEWNWSFGDGKSSTEQNPSHKYSNAGIYNVSLTVKNDFSTDSETKSNYITVQTTPTISTSDISEYTATSVIVGGNITSNGYAEISEKGIYYGTTNTPEIDGIKFPIISNFQPFSDTITNLEVNTTYYIRAYATNNIGTSYGNVVSVTTEEGLPLLSTSPVADITAISATSGGDITANGGFDITARGVCWSTSSNPTISDNKTLDGTGTGSFNSNITNLEVSTTYYVRAYATNTNGTSYGAEYSFTTEDGLPTITTAEISNITATSAESGGSITDNGGFEITARGVCWSINTNPTISDNKTLDGTGTGSFNSNITNLEVSTTYFVRAYATNINGTVYGSEFNFTTNDGLPTLTTAAVINITAISVQSGGNITNDGGFVVFARGVCWSTSPNPTIMDNVTNDGTGTGSYISSLTGLTEWTEYYARAFATNSIGTIYGNEITFQARNTIADYDGNIYSVVTIGSQTWMAENLKTKHYSDGTEISLIVSNSVWDGLSSSDKAYCYYDNLSTNIDLYGYLYTWSAAMNGSPSSSSNPSNIQGACPDGWHLPSDAEWTELTDYLASNWYSGNEGTVLKSTTGWHQDGNGTDNFHYTARPGGIRLDYGAFYDLRSTSNFWSSTEYDNSNVWYRTMRYNSTEVGKGANYKKCGLSIRCIKD